MEKRFHGEDYRRKYSNYFLKEVRIIESNELDWYKKGDPYCPFLWHLVAAEHLEIVNQGTFKKNRFSNQMSPLVQKAVGFDGNEYGRIGNSLLPREAKVRGGLTTGKQRKDDGFMSILGKSISLEDRKKNGKKGGLKRAESGFFSSEHQSTVGKIGGLISGKNRAESGHCAKIAGLGGHTRWHVNRDVVSPTCKLCKQS